MPFQKAKPRCRAIKACLYGQAGTGKTFTALLVAEGLAQRENGRVAFVNTEQGGIDFYTQKVPTRKPHPEPFDVDELFSRSVTEITRELRALSPAEHPVIVVDSGTHIWQACIDACNVKKNRNGQLPIWAWPKIKKPWRELIQWLLDCPQHVIFTARSGVEYGKDESGEEGAIGTKAKTEGETEYEFNHVFELVNTVRRAGEKPYLAAACKKDRSGVHSGESIPWPNFQNLAEPLLPFLADTHREQEDHDVTASKDRDALTAQEAERRVESKRTADSFCDLMRTVASLGDMAKLEEAGATLTDEAKAILLPDDLQRMRDAYKHAADTTRKIVAAAS